MFTVRKLNVLWYNYNKIKTKWTCGSSTRYKSSAEPKTKTYSHTILFPKTNFPSRSSNAIKEDIQKTAKFSDLYNWQRTHLTGSEYVLHDGPPYANGDLHMGHAVNKIIKDINNRNQVLKGCRVHYVPGWDCHGLPIELKALQKARKESGQPVTEPVKIREVARKFALETVQKQKEAFRSWGVMADWDDLCYLTLNKNYVKEQLQLFYKMYKSGLVYRALKPVYWSPSSKTALAEAELEYDPQYRSKEVYVTFPIEKPPDVIKDIVTRTPLHALIWTTTPWTLMANRAVAYSPNLKYSVVTLRDRTVVVASALVDTLAKELGVNLETIVEIDGKDLSGTTYHNKLLNLSLPLLPASHVTAEKGTGLVHTAPAHGPEDFLVALDNQMEVTCNVDEAGCFTNLHPELNGLPVLKEGQDAVINMLGDSLVHQGVYIHSYPLDWRTKKPVILRASHQWFIDTAALKDKALEALESIEIQPGALAPSARRNFSSQVRRRPYWCVSRQRVWGVPIPAINVGGEAVLDSRVISKLCELIDKRGADVWWTCDVSDLLTYDVIEDYKLEGKEVTKGKDIMDIWLDSGLSWHTLGGRRARLYCEGVDQLTGWFQAALLTSIALTDKAPYSSIFVHGFVVDDQKRKMSKSIGNVIDPATIIKGGKGQTAYGVDTLRWWVASHATQHSQIVISKKLLEDCQNEVVRIRNIIKYLLSVVNDLPKSDFDSKLELNYFDAYLVKSCQEFGEQIQEHFENFRYNNVAQCILFFISNKVSGLYCHCVKDRLYCSPKDSAERISAQMTVHTILVTLFKALGPILPHLVEEAWQHHPLCEQPFHFTQNVPVLETNSVDCNVMDTILDIKKEVYVLAKNEDLKKFEAKLYLEENLFRTLDKLNNQDGGDLSEILELSSVSLTVENGGSFRVELSNSSKTQCLRCRKYNAEENSDKCARCDSVLASL